MFNTFSPMDSSISLPSSQTSSLVNIPQSLSPSAQSTQASFFSPSFTNSQLDVKLVEPVIFFRGKPEEAVGCILRGDLMLHLSRPTKIKKLQLKFIGDLPETVNTELGKVSYCLYAQASRSRFTPKMKYRQPVEILRTIPDHLSYEISIPKKSYPIGQNIPIEMKICPYVKKLRVNGVRVELIEKTTYTSKNDQKVSDSKIGTTQELIEFGESRLMDDYEEGDVGNTIYQQNMNLIIPKCPSPIHYSCDTPLVSVAHDLKFSFALTLPYSPSKRAELKINIPITILSCRALEDYIGLPSYEDSFHCPCDPEYFRMARLVLGENVGEIFLNNNSSIAESCDSRNLA
ncbi:311_t:CDS:2 [Diversispora eburnea]|uniref:311_t:CDS:1 n=1 Tax=Diversispora eburnea TaxID=1213867 RepID=A0A9N8ZXP1_9GLOM|nr:311_t:CDS:2 [Diversispora eburnea]